MIVIDDRKHQETFERGGVIYYSNTGVAHYLGRSLAGLWLYWKEYEKRTGQPVPTVREKNSKYIKQDDLYKVILVLEDKFGLLADQIKRERPDLVAQVAKEVEERKGQHE